MDDSKFEAVRRFAVEIGDSSQAIRLYPFLRGGDLSIEMPAEHQIDAVFPFGASAGSLVIDLDEQRTLCGIEVLVPKKKWKRAERLPGLPKKLPIRTLRLLGNTTELSFEGPEPTLQYVPSVDALQISIEPLSPSARWVGLSERCFAYVNTAFSGDSLLPYETHEVESLRGPGRSARRIASKVAFVDGFTLLTPSLVARRAAGKPRPRRLHAGVGVDVRCPHAELRVGSDRPRHRPDGPPRRRRSAALRT